MPGEGSAVKIEAEEEDQGEVKGSARTLQDPKLPTPNEVRAHSLTHLPFRSWCEHCVKGRGREAPHRRIAEEPKIPEVHVDFCFIGDEGAGGETVPILLARERITRMGLATVVPRKTTGKFAAERVLAYMREVGIASTEITINSD